MRRNRESNILDALNAAQLEAVTAAAGPLLILAGAGSGKTRVLTRRIAYLIDAKRVPARAILAVTFTNKAAAEMRARVGRLLNAPPGGMWLGTFHGLCHRLLRLHYAEAGLPQAFEIIDSDDQVRLIRRVLRELELDENRWAPREMQWCINGHKEEARRAHDLPDGDYIAHTLRRVYQTYESFCARLGLVDFAELLLRALELFTRNQSVRELWQRRFAHVLVDEFQDTNAIQYRWLRILCDAHKNLFAVGDDDQSIYGWRGARVENLLNFQRHFPAAKVIRLEQNYRSTATILNAANAVIANNTGRLGKALWTDLTGGEKIRLYAAHNDLDEARFVVAAIEEWVARGHRRDSAAVLYRTGAQSRAFEERLLAAGLPYRVYGGLRFFERAEIKDALAYLRLIANRDSDPAFERVVNLPTRGIGARTVEAVRARAKAREISLWRAAAELVAEGKLPARAAAALQGFLRLIDAMAAATWELTLGEIADHALTHSGLLEHHGRERGERAEGRVENLQELVTAAGNFDANAVVGGDPIRRARASLSGRGGDGDGDGDGASDSHSDSDGDGDDAGDAPDVLSQFLANAALEAGDTQGAEWEDCVQLMSLHAAKGLEFKLVFLCGMEEGLFPHQRSIDEPGRLEEERRLCYVGMTRAMRQLTVCYAEVRRLYGREQYPSRSRFVGEIPPEYVEEIGDAGLGGAGFGARGFGGRGLGRGGDLGVGFGDRDGGDGFGGRGLNRGGNSGRGGDRGHGGGTHGRAIRPARAIQPAARRQVAADDGFAGLAPGRAVRHQKFGEGIIIALEGRGEHARVQVNFARAGVKWLVCQYAKLEAL